MSLLRDLLHKYKVDRRYEAAEGGEVVPVQALSLEEYVGDDGENNERHTLLYHLELHQREWAAVATEPDTIGGHLTTVFEESDSPTEDYHTNQGPVTADTSLL